MGIELAKVNIGVRGDTTKFANDINKNKGQMSGAMTKLAGTLGAIMGTVIAAVGIRSLISNAKESIKLAEIQIDAETRLAAVLKATGNQAGFTAEEMFKMASKMQEATTTGDEAILEVMTVITKFGKVSKENFERATELSLDLGNVMGKSPKRGANALARALVDPKLGLTTLQAQVDGITPEFIKMATAMHESGRVAEAQKLILDKLAGGVEGTSRALAKTPSGQLKNAKNRLGDVREELGRKLIPVATLFVEIQIKMQKVMNLVIGSVGQFIKGIETLNTRTGGFVVTLIQTTAATLGLVAAFKALRLAITLAGLSMQTALAATGIGLLLVALGAIVLAVISIIKWIGKMAAVQDSLSKNVKKLKRAWEVFSAAFAKAWNIFTTAVIAGAKMIAKALGIDLSTLPDTVAGIFDLIISTVSEFVLDAAEWFSVLVDNWILIWNNLPTIADVGLSLLLDAVVNTVGFIIRLFGVMFNNIGRTFPILLEGIVTLFSNIPSLIKSALTGKDIDSAILESLAKTSGKLAGVLKKSIAELEFDKLIEPSERSKQKIAKLGKVLDKLGRDKKKLEGKRDTLVDGMVDEGKKKTKPKEEVVEKVLVEFGRFDFKSFGQKFQDAMLKKEKNKEGEKMVALTEAGLTKQDELLKAVKENKPPVPTDPGTLTASESAAISSGGAL